MNKSAPTKTCCTCGTTRSRQWYRPHTVTPECRRCYTRRLKKKTAGLSAPTRIYMEMWER